MTPLNHPEEEEAWVSVDEDHPAASPSPPMLAANDKVTKAEKEESEPPAAEAQASSSAAACILASALRAMGEDATASQFADDAANADADAADVNVTNEATNELLCMCLVRNDSLAVDTIEGAVAVEAALDSILARDAEAGHYCGAWTSVLPRLLAEGLTAEVVPANTVATVGLLAPSHRTGRLAWVATTRTTAGVGGRYTLSSATLPRLPGWLPSCWGLRSCARRVERLVVTEHEVVRGLLLGGEGAVW